MPKFSTKADFQAATETEWRRLWEAADACGDQAALRATLAHLYAWHRLVLGWLRQENPDLPAAGYNWRQTPALNAALDEQYRDIDLAGVKRRLRRSHGQVMKLVDGLSDAQLLEAGYLAWTGKSPLLSYLAPNTVSHYRWAIKKLKKLAREER